MFKHSLRQLSYILLLLIAGCSFTKTIDGLSNGILNHNDPELIHEGLPTFLLILDGLLESKPDNINLLLSAAQLYGAYASTFVSDETRSQKLADRAQTYARHALCLELRKLCHSLDKPLDAVKQALNKTNKKDLKVLYAFNVSWVTWIQLHSNDWGAIADIPKATAIFNHIAEYDENYDNGGLQLYLGVLASQLPTHLGGKPEQGKKHFEKAIQISAGKNLMSKVLFAKYYARLVFNQNLHDRLLNEVIHADPLAPGLTLMNTLAQQQAKELLADSNDYF